MTCDAILEDLQKHPIMVTRSAQLVVLLWSHREVSLPVCYYFPFSSPAHTSLNSNCPPENLTFFRIACMFTTCIIMHARCNKTGTNGLYSIFRLRFQKITLGCSKITKPVVDNKDSACGG